MSKMISKNKNKKNTVFSLIETLISVFLITVGLLATVNLISKSMAESVDSRNQLIAGELAQEGIELVRNIRDNNWASGNTSFENFSKCAFGGSSICGIDKTGSFITAGTPYRLYLDSNNFYINSGTTATKFRRKLIIADDGVNKKITSVVTWNNTAPPDPASATCNTANKCTFVQETLTTWGE